jgi:hypothetical protein
VTAFFARPRPGSAPYLPDGWGDTYVQTLAEQAFGTGAVRCQVPAEGK